MEIPANFKEEDNILYGIRTAGLFEIKFNVTKKKNAITEAHKCFPCKRSCNSFKFNLG